MTCFAPRWLRRERSGWLRLRVAVALAVASATLLFEPLDAAARRLAAAVCAREASPIARLRPSRRLPLDTRDDIARDGRLLGARGKVYAPETGIARVDPVLPRRRRRDPSRDPAKAPIVFVDGIMTDARLLQRVLQSMADRTGRAVIGVHNATRGICRDVLQCVLDKIGVGHNPPVETVANIIRDALSTGAKPPILVGHSQGALIVSRALDRVRRELLREHTPAAAARLLRPFTVVTQGGASIGFPEGPRYIHVVNEVDAVPTIFGAAMPLAAKRPRERRLTFRLFHRPTLPSLPAGASLAERFARIVDAAVHGPEEIYLRAPLARFLGGKHAVDRAADEGQAVPARRPD